MKVSDVCTLGAKSSGQDDALSTAAWQMWESDCGFMPVLDADGRVVAVITDRDICMAAVLKGGPISNIRVRDVMSGDLYACSPEDDVREAMATMRLHQVRRLPVLDSDGALLGVLSLNDLALHARDGKVKSTDITPADVLHLLKAVCAHRAEATRTQPQDVPVHA